MKAMNVSDISLEGTRDAQEQFCKIWPSVKTGLQLLVGIVKNPIVKAAIEVVIKGGDAIASSICKPNAG